MCCATKICKLLLFIFNIIFFLLGAGCLALGIFLIVDDSDILSVIAKVPGTSNYDVASVLNETSFLENGAYMLIAGGAVVFVIAFCGLCGGIRESKCLLYIYAVFVLIILAIEIAAGVMCIFYSDEVELYLQDWLVTLVEDHYEGSTLGTDNLVTLSTDTTGISDAIDFAQVHLKCCSATNYTEYALSATAWAAEYNYTTGGSVSLISNAAVPLSCCKVTDTAAWPTDLANLAFTDLNACLTTASTASTNTDACYDTVKNLLVQYSKYVLGVGLGIGLIEILGVVAAFVLIKSKGGDKVAPN